jgi:hypothetical protein
MEIKFKGNGLVWNPIKNKLLCKFIDGEYTTSDHAEISILRESYLTDSDLDEYDKKRNAVERVTKSRAKAKAKEVK